MPTRLRHGRAPALAALLAAALPATASAAYAPKLSVAIDPATPGAPSRVSTTIDQGATETANRRVVVTIPPAFGLPAATIAAIPACTTQQLQARACPESTRIGSASARAAVLGLLPLGLSGTVHWGGPTGDGRFVVLVFLDNASVDQHLTLRGIVQPTRDGLTTTFDGLPSITTTSFTLVFDGGAKALLTTPTRCGTFSVTAAFTSQSGEQASSSAPVTIGGCLAPAPRLTRVVATRTRVRFRLAAPAVVRVLVKGPADRVQLDRRLNAPAGTTTVRLRRALRPGRYRVAVTAGAAGARTATRKVRLAVHR